MTAKISNNLIRGLIKSIIVLVPTYITAYLTDKMIYVIPMLAAASFVAASIDSSKIESRVEEYGYKSVVENYGETKDTIRAQNIEAFQRGKDTRFFVGNPQTGGMGITLTASSTVVYYSNSYNLEHRIQSEDRAHRIGQTNKVTYIDLICPKTVDEKIVKALRSKKQLAGQILGDEWQSWI